MEILHLIKNFRQTKGYSHQITFSIKHKACDSNRSAKIRLTPLDMFLNENLSQEIDVPVLTFHDITLFNLLIVFPVALVTIAR